MLTIFYLDGKLAAAADETGLVQIFQIQSRLQLRKCKGHKGPVHACDFSCSDGRFVLSGGDDLVRNKMNLDCSISQFFGFHKVLSLTLWFLMWNLIEYKIYRITLL